MTTEKLTLGDFPRPPRPVAFVAVVLVVGVAAVVLAGLVAGWEGVRPMVANLVDMLKGAVLLAVLAVMSAIMAVFGCLLGGMLRGWAPAWFGRSIGGAYLWVAAVVLLVVTAQCLIPPWESGSGEQWRSAGYAPLWDPPPPQLSEEGPIEDLPVRVRGGVLAWHLFGTGILLVFYARYHLQYHRELDEEIRNTPLQREEHAMTGEECMEMLRREIDEGKKNEDIGNTPP